MSELWNPTKEFIVSSNMKSFQNYIEHKYNVNFNNYDELWNWSIKELDEFWTSIADFFEVNFHQQPQSIISNYTDKMYKTSWFTGATLSYAEQLFSNSTSEYPALIYQNENNLAVELTWKELEEKVSSLQQFLIQNDIKKGDRIVGYLSNTPDAVISFLACNSIGAIWSCCSPDFGIESVIERFQQIEPKLFIANRTYQYQGKFYDKIDTITKIKDSIPSLKHCILVHNEDKSGFSNWYDIINQTPQKLIFTDVEFDHPIWILYSSGTTGKPKCIVHRTGGIIIEHLKALALHQDCKKGNRYLWYSTTGWMMWNYALSSMLVGCTLCIYDGATNYPNIETLWNFVDQQKIHHFGAGAAFYLACKKQNLRIKNNYKLNHLISLGSTGSPLPDEGFQYIYNDVKENVWLISLSGGTDVCSAFLGGSPMLKVYSGEIQCRMLGAAIEAWNEENKPVEEELGELMICKPMPSMPLFFWNDFDFSKYKDAYFEKNDHIWQHGDWLKITKNKGIIIYGRSDSTLNRNGIRIGTIEIYNAVNQINEVNDSLVICVEKRDGSSFMCLFVELIDGVHLDEKIKTKINQSAKNNYSPRHIPDEIIQVKAIPYTISGKKMELPIKKIMMGMPLTKSISLDAMRNPECINEYLTLASKTSFQVNI